VADQVEPAAEAVQPAGSVAVTDGVRGQAAGPELSGADDPVLARREPRDRRVAQSRNPDGLTRALLRRPQSNLVGSGAHRLEIAPRERPVVTL